MLGTNSNTTASAGSSQLDELLQLLINDSESRFVVHSEDPNIENKVEQLRGYSICQKEDVDYKNLKGLSIRVFFH